jgi:hypothetical protein
MNIHKTMLERLYNEYMVKDPMDGPVSLLTLQQVRDALKVNAMGEHSPGEWRCEMTGNYARVFCHDDPLGGDNLRGYCGEANARLIVKSPKLLKALEALLGWEEARIAHFGEDGPDEWIMEMARNAVAEAKGGQA